MIDFEVYSQDPDDNILITRYWAMDDEGKFIENASNLLPHNDIKNVSQLVKFINEISSAWDTDQNCSRCNKPRFIRSRSDAKGTLRNVAIVCKECNDREAEERTNAQHHEAAELKRLIDGATQDAREMTIDYGDIQDDIALILVALDKAINPRLLNGCFSCGDCQMLAPFNTDEFISRLWKSKVIIDRPELAKPGVYLVKDGVLRFYWGKAIYTLVPDKHLGRTQKAFEILEHRNFSDGQALRELWLDYVTAECMAYLYPQCELHSMYLEDEDTTQIKSILRTALETYSVSQLWFSIWKVVRDAATLSTREYYNKSKAAATIPGKLKRLLEDVAKNRNSLKEWDRPRDQAAGTLGDAFFYLFAINELTPGSYVMKVFDGLTKADGKPIETLEDQARMVMHRAISYDVELLVLQKFAERIRKGDDISGALDYVFKEYPQFRRVEDYM